MHRCLPPWRRDRKSTRLNSSHLVSSYAVFCRSPDRYPLSLHDALPIFASILLGLAGLLAGMLPFHGSPSVKAREGVWRLWFPPLLLASCGVIVGVAPWVVNAPLSAAVATRSEEHTSELQSPCKLVCRLLPLSRPLPSFPTRRSSDLRQHSSRAGRPFGRDAAVSRLAVC